MRPLPPTAANSKDWHQLIVDSKQMPLRGRLQAAWPQVERRIDEYLDAGPIGLASDDLGHGCTAPTCDPCLSADLQALWGTTTNLSALRAYLLAVLGRNNYCPYCGLSEAYELDHYLPKVAYPEFTVTAANLIPCCGRCNLLKRDADAMTAQRILNPVLDPLDQKLFTCVLEGSRPQDLIARFDVDRYAADGLAETCDFHLDALELRLRLSVAAGQEIAVFFTMAALDGSTVDAGLAATATLAAESNRRTWSPNYWKTLLFDALAVWLEGL